MTKILKFMAFFAGDTTTKSCRKFRKRIEAMQVAEGKSLNK
jgi:hypothetical protein